ncbi:MAG: antibiotic biosynthesis monooxygenase [Propionibacteriales bacterium]|nr:antibiotic biosynthesis monooxygenase [Propionibacteriales bacterium]
MILIVVKFPVKPEYAESFPQRVREFTEATRAEPANLSFEWSRSLDDPNLYVLVEAFTDDGAEPHVTSDHFRQMTQEFPQYLTATPAIISRQVDGAGWDEMGELQIN